MAALVMLCLASLFLLEAPQISCSEADVHARARHHTRTLEANSTLLDLLLSPHRDEATRAEIYDMLHSAEPARALPATPAFPPSRAPAGALPQQTELLQIPEALVQKDAYHWETDPTRDRRTFQGTVTGLMLGLTCIIVLLAYVGLVAYRRYIMVKTGNKHELLRNEDNTRETRIDL